MASQRFDPKDLQRHAIIGKAVARAVVDAPEYMFEAFANGDVDRGSGFLARRIVTEIHHAGFCLKDADKKPFRPDEDEFEIAPEQRMALEDYVRLGLELTGVGTRVILKAHDRRNQRDAIDQVTEIICNSFRVNQVVLKRRRNPWDR